MRYPQLALRVIGLVLALGWVSVAGALPEQIAVVTATQMEVMRDGRVSGKVSVTAGTQLDLEAIEGEYVLVRIRGMRGRLLSKFTDLAAHIPAATEEALATPRSAPPPAVPARAQANAGAAIGKSPAPVAAAPARTATPTPAPAPTAPPASSTTVKPAVTPAPATAQPMEKKSGVAPRQSAEVDEAVTKAGLAVLGGVFLVSLFLIVANWRLFTKAGRPGWAALVPIYNLIVWQQISGKPVWWLFLYFVPVANLVVVVLTSFGLASNFGKGKAFGLGLVLVPFVFIPILAFGDAVYVGSPP